MTNRLRILLLINILSMILFMLSDSVDLVYRNRLSLSLIRKMLISCVFYTFPGEAEAWQKIHIGKEP